MKEFISLADANPEVASWWHPTKNGNMTPKDVAPRSHKRVWWLYPYDDPNTGKHFDFEWQATVDNTTESGRCPFLSNQVIWVGFNDLQTKNPVLAAEWHPTKNGDLTPKDVTVSCNKKVWWLVHYFDSRTQRNFDFEWQATVGSRNSGCGCPYIDGHDVWPGFNDLATRHPDIAQEWHPTKNKDLTPQKFTEYSGRKVWWMLNHFDERTGKTFCFEWEATIRDRVCGDGCPYLSGHQIFVGFNDLETINPKLAAEWDYDKNVTSPSEYLAASHAQVWWKCGFGHSWKASIDRRHTQGTGCPHCKKSLRTSYPEITTYYYIHKHFPDAISGDRKTFGFELDVYIPSIKTAVEYDGLVWHGDKAMKDSDKNKKCSNLGINLIRIRELGCPKLESHNSVIYEVIPDNKESFVNVLKEVGKRLNVEFDVDLDRDATEIFSIIDFAKRKNSLAELYPNVAKEWHPTKNGNLRPDCVKSQSSIKVWWQITHIDENGKEFVLEWQDKISHRTGKNRGCPYFAGRQVLTGFNDLASQHPDIAEQWDYEKNDTKLSPQTIVSHSHQKIWWKCSDGHSWEATVDNRSNGRGCPHCYALSRKSKSK